MKKYLCLLLTLTMLCGLASPAFAESGDVPEGYIPIRTAQELDNIRNNLNDKYILMNDIDLSGFENWVPIGTEETPLTGIIDGNLHKITGLNITDIGENKFAGLFGYAKGAEIKSIIISGTIDLTTDAVTAAGVCAKAKNTSFTNCKNNTIINIKTKSLVKQHYCGGISGESNNCIFSMCCNYGSFGINSVDILSEILPAISVSTLVGGIAGEAVNTFIHDCYNAGEIKIFVTDCETITGGIAGDLMPAEKATTVFNCYNSGAIYYNDKNVTKEISEEFSIAVSPTVGFFNMLYDEIEQYHIIRNCFYLESTGYDEFSTALSSELLSQKQTFSGFDFAKTWKLPLSVKKPVLWYEEELSSINLVLKTGQTKKIELYDSNIKTAVSDDEKIAIVLDNGIKGIKAGTTEIRILLENDSELLYSVTVKFSLIYWLIDYISNFFRSIIKR